MSDDENIIAFTYFYGIPFKKKYIPFLFSNRTICEGNDIDFLGHMLTIYIEEILGDFGDDEVYYTDTEETKTISDLRDVLYDHMDKKFLYNKGLYIISKSKEYKNNLILMLHALHP